MARRGRCHCGEVLFFRKTVVGYKRRCPRCHAIVRLRCEADSALSRVTTLPDLPPPIPGRTPAPEAHVASLADFDPDLPVVEMQICERPTVREGDSGEGAKS
jgi:hypothetical protein